ncbi:MAG: lysophospholipid acyltransferase family protein [Bowdeniella nasicola]|nr:lysophospholipid acyltransferase family protein [Bowdeniella nasicola]
MTAHQIRRGGPRWSRPIGWMMDHLWWNTTVVGTHHIPAFGAALIAANHVGIMDGPVVHGALPRGSHFMVKQEFFDSPLGFLMRWSGQIPVDRQAGSASLRHALTLLNEGRVVGIFPEGTRGRGTVQTVHPGVAWLAIRSGAPLIPTAVLGTRKRGDQRSHIPKFRAKLHVEFGPPLLIDTEGLKGRAATQRAISEISATLSAHIAAVSKRTGIALPN